MLELRQPNARQLVVVDENRQCPYCDLIFSYHNEVKEHIMLDHRDHAEVVAGIEPHELPARLTGVRCGRAERRRDRAAPRRRRRHRRRRHEDQRHGPRCHRPFLVDRMAEIPSRVSEGPDAALDAIARRWTVPSTPAAWPTPPCSPSASTRRPGQRHRGDLVEGIDELPAAGVARLRHPRARPNPTSACR